MRIGIFGEHPDLDPGFSGAMAINQLKAFWAKGHSATLFIPNTPTDRLDQNLQRLGLQSTLELSRYGIDFDIQPIDDPKDFPNSIDFLIWQTYKPFHQHLWPHLRNFHISKSVPRFAANRSSFFRKKAIDFFGKF